MQQNEVKRVETIAHIVGDQYLMIIEYGYDDNDDDNALSGDWAAHDQWARDNPPAGYTFAHWSIEDEAGFTRCDVSGDMGYCHIVQAVYFSDKG